MPMLRSTINYCIDSGKSKSIKQQQQQQQQLLDHGSAAGSIIHTLDHHHHHHYCDCSCKTLAPISCVSPTWAIIGTTRHNSSLLTVQAGNRFTTESSSLSFNSIKRAKGKRINSNDLPVHLMLLVLILFTALASLCEALNQEEAGPSGARAYRLSQIAPISTDRLSELTAIRLPAALNKVLNNNYQYSSNHLTAIDHTNGGAQTNGNSYAIVAQQPLQVPQALGLTTEKQQYELFDNSYVIDNKRYSELEAKRCFTSTIVDRPEVMEPTFTIVRARGDTCINATVTPNAILKAGYDPRKRTVVAVHGFTQSYPKTKWLNLIRLLFLNNPRKLRNYNLIIMDWGKGAEKPFFSAAANTHVMGTFLSIFLHRLIDLGANRMNIHLIAHSLGAHVAGFAGKRIKPPIGRITALDPAGPCFGKFFSDTYNLRLNPDDAYLVDVFHYDDSFLGLAGQHGQFDVYVNGGSSQPGCTDNVRSMMSALVTVISGRDRVLSESHTRSTELPVLSLRSGYCQNVAYECADYETFLKGECASCDKLNNQCYLMDFAFQFNDTDSEFPLRTSRPSKKFFINTNDKENFCLQHYQIKITVIPNTLSNWFKNRISLQLTNTNGTTLTTELTNQASDNILTGLLTFSDFPQKFIKAEVKAPKSATNWNKNIQAIEINFMSNIDHLIRKRLSSKLCPLSEYTLRERTMDTNEFNANQFVQCL